MKTNYFNIGDKVYILHEKGQIDEDEVINIGKKYIKLKTNPLRYYLRDEKDMFFTCDREWGETLRLFKTKEHIADYKEYIALTFELQHELTNLRQYTLEQLKQINKIIN